MANFLSTKHAPLAEHLVDYLYLLQNDCERFLAPILLKLLCCRHKSGNCLGPVIVIGNPGDHLGILCRQANNLSVIQSQLLNILNFQTFSCISRYDQSFGLVTIQWHCICARTQCH